MKNVTKLMIREYNIKKLGYDFMGYKVHRTEDLSFHHLIYPKRDCPKLGLGDGYLEWNGVILNQDTAHEYLHKIEMYDRERFDYVTQIMIYMKRKQYLDIDDIITIHILLEQFENKFQEQKTKSGKYIIKSKYITDRISFK